MCRDNRVRTTPDRTKEKGKCWYCLEQRSYGHKCQNVKSIVHAITMQGHSEEDNDSGDTNELYHDAEPILPALTPVPVDQPNSPATKPYEQPSTLMHISAEALHGLPGDTTLSVLVKIGNYQAVALEDRYKHLYRQGCCHKGQTTSHSYSDS
jgi:hypothetical protein